MSAQLYSHTRHERARLLIADVVHHLELALEGLVVLTEMASGHYIYTPLIAAQSGASRVIAVVKDTPYGSKDEIIETGRSLINDWGMDDRVEIASTLSPGVIDQADIVTNLGLLRPINLEFISQMKPGSVIPYMREAWEYRPEDVDLLACQAHNIPVMGTNENYDGLAIFDFCGPLAAKMLFEANIEVSRNSIVVISQDRFGDVICPYLRACGSNVLHINGKEKLDLEGIERLDALLVASFTTGQMIVGPGGWIDPRALASHHPECTIVQFAGLVDVESAAAHGITCIPDYSIGPHRMAQTLAALGPKPVIDLHAAGLKVGELMWHKMRILQKAERVEESLAAEHLLCQRLSAQIDERKP